MLTPLVDAEQQIRLLRLLPGQQDDPIAAELHIFDRDKVPDYRAISYVWGDDRAKRDVSINGKTQSVWRNCYYALWQARTHCAFAFIWIDSLCIDQDNQEEKGHQVRRIGDVYSSAKLVLVCIGSDAEDIDIITAFAPELEVYDLDADVMTSYTRRDRVVSDRSTTPTARLMQRLEPGPSYTPDIAQAFKQSCGNFARLPYWERLWIVQELKLSSEKVLLSGNRSISWRLVSNLLLWNNLLHGPWTLFEPTSPLRVLGNILQQGQFSLVAQLSQLKCFDPRDRVYGTLGIIKWTNIVIYPDYGRSRVDLAALLLENGFMDEENPLDLLRMLRIDGDNDDIRQLVRQSCEQNVPAQDVPMSRVPRILASFSELFEVDDQRHLEARCIYIGGDTPSLWHHEVDHMLDTIAASELTSSPGQRLHRIYRDDGMLQRLRQRVPRAVYSIGTPRRLAAVVCSEAIHGDYLAQIVGYNQDVHCLVLRKRDGVFQIVGQALLVDHNLDSDGVSTDVSVVPTSIEISPCDWMVFSVQDLRFSQNNPESDYEVFPLARFERLLTSIHGVVSFAPSVYHTNSSVFSEAGRTTVQLETFRKPSLSGSDTSNGSSIPLPFPQATVRWRCAIENVLDRERQRERQPTTEDRWVELAELAIEAHDDSMPQPEGEEFAELVETTIKSNAAQAGLIPLPHSPPPDYDEDQEI